MFWFFQFDHLLRINTATLFPRIDSQFVGFDSADLFGSVRFWTPFPTTRLCATKYRIRYYAIPWRATIWSRLSGNCPLSGSEKRCWRLKPRAELQEWSVFYPASIFVFPFRISISGSFLPDLYTKDHPESDSSPNLAARMTPFLSMHQFKFSGTPVTVYNLPVYFHLGIFAILS